MAKFRNFLRKQISPFLQKAWKWYNSRSHSYHFRDLTIIIPPTVFHPALFFSTQYFIRFLDKQAIEDKTVWEIGAGSGLISLLCAQRGAQVTASDISFEAVNGLIANVQRNNISNITIVASDLFEKIKPKEFDIILINPPYYPKNPQNTAEKAFYCGEDFDYFHRLFEGLSSYMNHSSKVWMVLSEDCELTEIQSIAERKSFTWQLLEKESIWGEENYIFEMGLERSFREPQ